MIGDTDFQRPEASERRVRKRFRTARQLQWGDLSKQRHVSQRPLGNGTAGPGMGGRCDSPATKISTPFFCYCQAALL